MTKEILDEVSGAARAAFHVAETIKDKADSYARYQDANGRKMIATVGVIIEEDKGQHDRVIEDYGKK